MITVKRKLQFIIEVRKKIKIFESHLTSFCFILYAVEDLVNHCTLTRQYKSQLY